MKANSQALAPAVRCDEKRSVILQGSQASKHYNIESRNIARNMAEYSSHLRITFRVNTSENKNYKIPGAHIYFNPHECNAMHMGMQTWMAFNSTKRSVAVTFLVFLGPSEAISIPSKKSVYLVYGWEHVKVLLYMTSFDWEPDQAQQCSL